jgi:transposase
MGRYRKPTVSSPMATRSKGTAKFGKEHVAKDTTPKKRSNNNIKSYNEKRKQQKKYEEDKALLKPRKGEFMGVQASRLILLAILHNLQKNSMTEFQVLKEVAQMFGMSYNTINSIWQLWVTKRQIRQKSKTRRITTSTLEAEHIKYLVDAINQENARGVCTIKKILKLFREKFTAKVSPDTIKRILKKMGYTYSRVYRGNITMTEKRRLQIRKFLIEYSKAMKLEKEGGWVIAYLDETYVNQQHHRHYTWVPKRVRKLPGKSGRGNRAIILHSMTSHGVIPGCELVFAAHKKTGDYHGNMNADLFEKYIKECLIPAFKKQFPNKKCILVMDNAPYHKAPTTPIDLSTKESCIHILRSLGEENIEYGGRTYTLEQAKQRHPWGIHKDALVEIVKKRISEKNPDAVKSRTEKLFKPLGWKVIWTPPYCPKVQPIELLWAKVKGGVAEKYHPDRTMELIITQVKEEFANITTE